MTFKQFNGHFNLLFILSTDSLTIGIDQWINENWLIDWSEQQQKELSQLNWTKTPKRSAKK